jgi:predicted DNA-binding protein with PD1-like motif
MKYFRGATAVEIIAIRLDPGDDLRRSLNEAVDQLQLAAGAIISGSGTLSRIALESAVTDSHPPITQRTERNGAAEIVAAQGVIASGSARVTLTLAHGGETFCGLAVDGCAVLHRAEFVLLRAGGTRWAYAPGEATGTPMLEAVLPPGAMPITLMGQPVDVNAVALIPISLIRRHRALPVARTGDLLVVAMTDANDPFAIDAFRTASGLRVQAVAVPAVELLPAIEKVLAR